MSENPGECASLKAIAIEYVKERGWWVLPLHYPIFPGNEIGVAGRCSCGKPKCNSAAKHPLIHNGEKGASNNPDVINSWWDRWPEANIGIATGPSGLAIIDIDGRAGQEQFLKELAPLPETLTAITGREDGEHLYYKGIIKSSQVRGEYIDVRGITGYVVAPGSRHISGKLYKWKTARETVTTPEGTRSSACQPLPEKVIHWASRRGKLLGGNKRPRLPVAFAAKAATTTETEELATAPDGAADASHRTESVPAGRTNPEGKPLRRSAGDKLRQAELPLYSPQEAERLCSALKFIPPDIDGRTWASFGTALFDLEWIVSDNNGAEIDVGFEIWDSWSKRSKGQGPGKGEYKGRSDLAKRWSKFIRNYNGVPFTIASIYEHAKRAGWTGHEKVNISNINGVKSFPNTFNLNTSATPIEFVDFTARGTLAATCANTRVALRGLGIECKYDLFHERQMVGGEFLGRWAGEVADDTVLAIRAKIRENWKLDPPSQTCIDALTMECMDHAFDPVLDYLDSLKWDGKPRLRTWTSDYLGSPVTALNQMIGALSLIAAIRRVKQPGYKFDHIIVLEGAEGVGKSSAIRVLAGKENFSDQAILMEDDRRQQELVQGVWLYEIAELTGMRRAEIEHVKAFITREVDRTRPAYGRKRVDKPRRCIFWATTNDHNYLISQTGNRRFWPLVCGWIDLTGLALIRDQLWAEACTIEARGQPLHLPQALWSEMTLRQEQRRQRDPWEDTIEECINGTRKSQIVQEHINEHGQKELRVATRDIIGGLLEIPEAKSSMADLKRVANIMRKLGWDGPDVKRFYFDKQGGITVTKRGFFKTL